MVKKTNALRKLDAKKILYQVITYDTSDGKIDGVSVAHKIGEDVTSVYKTLLLSGVKGFYVALLPVDMEIDLKKAAHVFGEKSVHMLPVKDLLKTTGYERGGVHPLG